MDTKLHNTKPTSMARSCMKNERFQLEQSNTIVNEANTNWARRHIVYMGLVYFSSFRFGLVLYAIPDGHKPKWELEEDELRGWSKFGEAIQFVRINNVRSWFAFVKWTSHSFLLRMIAMKVWFENVQNDDDVERNNNNNNKNINNNNDRMFDIFFSKLIKLENRKKSLFRFISS